jgi:hypothetical protein
MNLERIGAIEKVASQEETGFCHLYFDAEQGRLCATNGHALIVCECEAEPGDVSGLISVEALQQYRKFRKENKLPNMVKFRALKTKLVVEDLTEGKVFSFRRPEGTFPTYDNLMPYIPADTPPSVTFDPKMLMQIAEAFPSVEFGGAGSQSVSLWLLPEHRAQSAAEIKEAQQKGEPLRSAPAIIIRGHHTGGLAILMPMRYHIGEDKWNTNLPGKPLKAADTQDKKTAKEPGKKQPAPAHDPAPPKKPVSPAHPEKVEKAMRTM